jgi:cytochrome c553
MILLLSVGLALGQTAGSAPQALTVLPVSLLHLMRANVEIPADGIWAVENNKMLSDEEWLLAQQDSINLTVAARLVSLPGTGKQDAAWVANADWQAWARDLQQTALNVGQAVDAKDQTKLATAADHLVDVCQSCHDKYRPENPSDGVARYPFYPPRVLKK